MSRANWIVIGTLALASVAGIVSFFVGFFWVSPVRTWEAFLTNLLFWTGIAQGGVLVSAALYICQARWGGSGLYRLAEAFAGFLPFGFVFFWVLFAGRYTIFSWALHPLPYKAIYLNVPFLFARDGGLLLTMWLLSWWLVRASRSPKAIEWAEDYDSLDEAPSLVARLALAVAISFAISYSVIAIDLVMSLSPQWYSTMFPLYFCFGVFVTGFMAMGLLAAVGKRPIRHDSAAERGGVLHDLGKLIFAAPTFWAYLLFSMYLVIWYGDIPKETFFVATRVNYAPWGKLGWAALCLIWVVPFFLLLGRQAKRRSAILAAACLSGLVGFWLERYVLISPSLTPWHVPFGWIEILVTLGFGGIFGLASFSGIRKINEGVSRDREQRTPSRAA